jgi:hypothetical protein
MILHRNTGKSNASRCPSSCKFTHLTHLIHSSFSSGVAADMRYTVCLPSTTKHTAIITHAAKSCHEQILHLLGSVKIPELWKKKTLSQFSPHWVSSHSITCIKDIVPKNRQDMVENWGRVEKPWGNKDGCRSLIARRPTWSGNGGGGGGRECSFNYVTSM